MSRFDARDANAKAVLVTLQATCERCCVVLRGLFQVPVKITIVIRVPGLSRGDTVFGDDDPAEAIEAIKRVAATRHDSSLPGG